MKRFRRDKHLLGRIESFSDLVFGFVVPMMAASLKIPNTPAEMVGSRKGFLVFAVSFGLLSVLWLRHHRMMRRFFVPDPFGILLVFAVLGTVALYAYPLHLYFRFPEDPIAFRAYLWGLSFLSFLYLLMALYAMFRMGYKWTPRLAYEARRIIVANAMIGAAMATYPLLAKDDMSVIAIPLVAVVLFRAALPWIKGRGAGISTGDPLGSG